MNLQQLEYITALNKFRHFGKAADECKVTQPTLSTMIQKLEEELGVKLFERTRQHVVPTTIGEKIIAQAEEVIRKSNLITDIIDEEKDELRGSIKLAILPTIAPYLLPLIIPKIEKRLPHLDITFTELMTSECIDCIQDNSIDIAIIASSMMRENVDEVKLFYEEFMGYVAESEELFKKEMIRSSEVDGRHLWLLDEGHCFRDQLVKFCALRQQSHRRFTYKRGSLETFMHLVERGYGITFVPELFVKMATDRQHNFIRPFMIPRPTRCITMCTKSDYIRKGIITELINIIRESVPQEMHNLRVGQTEV